MWYRIFNRLTKKYMRQDDGSFLVFQYPIQGERYIERHLSPNVYKIVEFKKGKL